MIQINEGGALPFLVGFSTERKGRAVGDYAVPTAVPKSIAVGAHHTVVLPLTRPPAPCHEGFRTRNKLYSECDLVFHREGAAIVDFRKAWAAACTKAEVKWLRFHDLRRSAVRNMDRAGIPRATIRRIIGHETDAMFDRYRIVDQRDVDEAGAKAEQYLNDQPKSRPNPKDEST
ncbi:MAG: tyrosine-type recombinase/integrase [Bryobacterales bacterium]|nr:tyrosine-type recombinase/integrase [Bryobacterales bacterium]